MPAYNFVKLENTDLQRVLAFLPESERNNVRGVYYAQMDQNGMLCGVVGVRRRAWHETEIRHLFVAETYRRQGMAKALVKRAFLGARGMRVVATVLSNNEPSVRAFLANRFECIDVFLNPNTQNTVMVLRRLKRSAVVPVQNPVVITESAQPSAPRPNDRGTVNNAVH